MRKKCLFAGFVFSFLVSICIVSGATAWADDFKWPSMLRIGTPSSQSGSFASTNGWAPILSKEKGINVRVVPEGSEFRRMDRAYVNKEFELNSQYITDTGMYYDGGGSFKVLRAAPIRIVWFHCDTPWGYAVRGDSELKTIYDIKKKGTRVAVATMAAGIMMTAKKALPAFVGMSPEEADAMWTWVPCGSYPDNCRTIPDGRADVAYVTPISSITSEMEAHPKGLRWLSMPAKDKEGWSRFMNYRTTAIPSKAGFGVKSAIGVEMISSACLYNTTPDANQELIYHLAKWFNEAYDRYKVTHVVASRMSVKNFRAFLDYCPLPIADGTIKYLREIGVWTEEDDKWNKGAIELMDRWVAARNAALDEAKEKGVKLHYEDEEFIQIFKKHTEGIPAFRTRL